jgi:hypothetical protein
MKRIRKRAKLLVKKLERRFSGDKSRAKHK